MESVLISYLVLGMLLLADAKESYKCSEDPDNECRFPFTYKGKVYNECVDGTWGDWCYIDDDENYEYCKLCEDAEESVQVLDSRNLKTANILAVSTTDEISTGMTTTQKAVDPRLVKVPTHRNSATDNYNQDEDGDKANGKSGHVTVILVILLLQVIIACVSCAFITCVQFM